MNSKLRPVVALLLGGFALALAARGSVSATSSPRSPDSHLLIVSDRDGDNDVYGVNAALPRLPGSHLLFVSDRDGDNDVYGVSADAHRQVALTRNRVKDDEAVVSPDGRWFAVERGYRGAVLVAANGRRERKLGESTTPHLFSPNGRLLLFTHYSAADVLSMRLLPVDGGRVRRLGPGFPRSFSPNGGAVAWSDDYGRVGVTQLPTLARRLLAGSAGASAIAWSRDGTRIAIEKRRERIEADLYTVYVSDVRRPDRPPKTILTASSSLEAQWLRGGKLGSFASLSIARAARSALSTPAAAT
jgi:Tol biopolymer transport system component